MKYLSFIIILIFQQSFGQNSCPTKKVVSKLIKENIDYYSIHTVGFIVTKNHWEMCNMDSSFYKSDTIRLYNNDYYNYHSNICCYFINWSFHKKSTFRQFESHICKNSLIIKDSKINLFKIKLKTKEGQLYLSIFDENSKLVDNFIVQSVVKVEQNKFSEITLIRTK